jgi:hypothetical protein
MGKRVFLPAVRCASTAAAIDKAQVRTNIVTALSLSPTILTFLSPFVFDSPKAEVDALEREMSTSWWRGGVWQKNLVCTVVCN